MVTEYILPIGIDGTKFSDEISKARILVTQLRDETKRSTDTMTTSFTGAGKAASNITGELIKTTQSITDESKAIANNNTQLLTTLDTLSKVATSQGKAFSADQLNKFSTAVKATQSGLNDILSKGAANFDPSKLQALSKQLENVTNDADQLKVIIGFIQENLSDLHLNPEETVQLNNYIKLIQSAFDAFNNKTINIPVKVDTTAVTQAAEVIDESLQIKPTIVFSEEDINNVIQQIKQQVSSSNIDVNILTNAVSQGTEILQSLDQESTAYKTLSSSIDLANTKLNEYSATTHNTTASVVELRNALLAKKVELVNTNDIQEAAALNKEIQSLEQQIINFGNAGREGFDDLGKKIDTATGKTTTLLTLYRNLRNEISQLKLTDPSNPKIPLLIAQATELEHTLINTNKELALAASNTSHLDAGVQAVQGIVGVFAAAQGAIALFGTENEDLQRALLKVNAAMSILQGLQQAGQLLDKNSALNVFLLQTLRLNQAKNTAAAAVSEGELAGAETLQAGAATEATVATEELNTAMAANPAGILLLSLGTLIGLIEIFTSDTNDAADAEERLNKQLDYNKDFSEGVIANMKQSGAERIALMKTQNASEQSIRDEEKKQLQAQYNEFVQDNQKTIDAGEEAAGKLQEIVKNGGIVIQQLKSINTITGETELITQRQKVSADELKNLQETANKGLAIQKEADKIQSDLKVKDLDNTAANNKGLDDARKKENDKAKADFDKRLAIEAAYQKALSDLIKQYRNTSIDLLADGRDKQKAQALAQLQDNLEQVDQLLAQQKKAGTLTVALQQAANNEKEAQEQKYFQTLLGIDSEFYKKQADLLKGANDAINEVFETSTQRQVDQTEKRFDDLIASLQEQNKKINEQATASPQDLVAVEKNNEAIENLTKARNSAIDKINTDAALQQIETQKQLDLDTIDQLRVSGLNEEQLTKVKDDLKLKRQKEAAEESITVLTGELEKEKKLTEDQVKELLDPANLETAKSEGKSIFEFLGIKLDNPDDEKKLNDLILLLDKLFHAANPESKPDPDLFKALGINEKNVKIYSDAISKAGQLTSDFLQNSIDQSQRLIDQKETEINTLKDQVDSVQSELEKQLQLQQEGYANNVDAKQKELNALKTQEETATKQKEELQARQQKLQRQQIIADTFAQSSNLITAASDIFKTFAKIPFVGVPLAIAAIGLMIGTFVTAKINALKAVGQAPSFRKGGLKRLSIQGPAHEDGGVGLYNEKTGKKLAEYEGGEDLYAVNKRSSKKHLQLLDAINNDDEERMRALIIPLKTDAFEAMHTLRKVVKESPKPPMEEIASVNRTAKEVHEIIIRNGLQKSDLNRLNDLKHLEKIAENTKKEDVEVITDYGDYFIIKTKGRTRKVWKKHA